MDVDANSFHNRLKNACEQKKSYLCVGIDPRQQYLPNPWNTSASDFKTIAQSFLAFGKEIIDLVHRDVPIIKPQSAFFEMLGHFGVKALEDLSAYAHDKNLMVIGDVKRGDIGSTAEAYAQAAFRLHQGRPLFDAVTVNPYLGADGVLPFVRAAQDVGSGVFVLCKTSNPSSSDLQDVITDEAISIYSLVAKMITKWGSDQPGLVGAVVGATHPQELAALRHQLPNAWILIPGIGAQGGQIKDVLTGFGQGPCQSLLSASRSITFPWLNQGIDAPEHWRALVTKAVENINSETRRHLFQ
ncbi:MAG: orotidine-5'-phosphate decarboxylase [Planctomycetota bacterium]|jgi:orotidine-5'-phosphate decarboxylase